MRAPFRYRAWRRSRARCGPRSASVSSRRRIPGSSGKLQRYHDGTSRQSRRGWARRRRSYARRACLARDDIASVQRMRWRARKELNPLWRGFGGRRSTDELHARTGWRNRTAALRGHDPSPYHLAKPANARAVVTDARTTILVAEAGLEPAAVEAYEASALPLS